MKYIKVSSDSPFENIIGFSRAVRVGNYVTVSGTAPIDKNGTTYGIGDPELQMRKCIEIISDALEKAGSGIKDVIKTRILLKRINDWDKVAKVHAEYFRDIKPATIVFEVSSFVNPEWLVEIECDAYVKDSRV
ncbi:MAG: hypothetical protein A2V66_15305 [Ignavibacteria bacterium RBG_13_36_8]|nr:MAG: hypothetical protein A2V66_15305 [Ignavibacteria bacterium RBG_13_36_8]